jgi:hypothetical protein
MLGCAETLCPDVEVSMVVNLLGRAAPAYRPVRVPTKRWSCSRGARSPRGRPRPELALDRREVAPDRLAADLAVSELEHVEKAEAHEAAATLAEKLAPVGDVALPERLVDDEVVAVEPAERRDLLALHAGEERLVEGADLGSVAERAGRGGDDLVHGVLGEARHHALHVVGRLEPEMIVDGPVHLLARHVHDIHLDRGILIS